MIAAITIIPIKVLDHPLMASTLFISALFFSLSRSF